MGLALLTGVSLPQIFGVKFLLLLFK